MPTTFAEWIQLLIDHDELVEWLVGGFAIMSFVTTGLETAFPDFATRPKWARFIVGGFTPFTVNLGKLVVWILAKFGIDLRGSQDPPLPPSSVRNAEKPA